MPESIPLWELHFYAGVGALFLWGKLAKHGREVYGLTDVLERMGCSSKVRRALEPVLFVALGAFIAVGFVQPTTIPQAIAAGISWTGLFSK